jgi:DNA-directed RNA polymerase I subunit RPA43
METWKASITPEMIEAENQWRRAQRANTTKKKSPKLFRDETKPRRPLNGFMQFCQEVRSDSERSNKILGTRTPADIPVVEQTKGLSSYWKSMSEEERKVYNDKYAEDKRQYDEAIEQWKAEKGVKA